MCAHFGQQCFFLKCFIKKGLKFTSNPWGAFYLLLVVNHGFRLTRTNSHSSCEPPQCSPTDHLQKAEMSPRGFPNLTSLLCYCQLHLEFLSIDSKNRVGYNKGQSCWGSVLLDFVAKIHPQLIFLVRRTVRRSRLNLLSVSVQILNHITMQVFAAAPVKWIRAHETIQSYRWNPRIDQCVIILSTKYEHSGAPVKHTNKLKHTHAYIHLSPCLLKSLSSGLIKQIHTSTALIHWIL